jgi:hypothetical protein
MCFVSRPEIITVHVATPARGRLRKRHSFWPRLQSARRYKCYNRDFTQLYVNMVIKFLYIYWGKDFRNWKFFLSDKNCPKFGRISKWHALYTAMSKFGNQLTYLSLLLSRMHIQKAPKYIHIPNEPYLSGSRFMVPYIVVITWMKTPTRCTLF